MIKVLIPSCGHHNVVKLHLTAKFWLHLTLVPAFGKSDSIKWYCSWLKLWEYNRNERHWNQAAYQSLVRRQSKTDQSEIIWVRNWNACLFLRFKDKSMAKIYKYSNNTKFCKFLIPRSQSDGCDENEAFIKALSCSRSFCDEGVDDVPQNTIQESADQQFYSLKCNSTLIKCDFMICHVSNATSQVQWSSPIIQFEQTFSSFKFILQKYSIDYFIDYW